MRAAVYNSAIPQAILKTVNRAVTGLSRTLPVFFVVIVVVVWAMAAHAADSSGNWSGPEEQLARKIVAVTGPGAVALTVENRSSLTRRDQQIILNGLHDALERLGVRSVPAEQAAASVNVSLSENAGSYVWVAQIRQGGNNDENAVVMVSMARPAGTVTTRDSTPLTLGKILLWSQQDPILDVAVLEENAAPIRIAMLEPEKVSLYRMQSGKWQEEQALPIVHARPWPRDLRGRLIPSREHLLDVFLPGVICRGAVAAAMTLACRESDDPWPLTAAEQSGGSAASIANAPSANFPAMKAFFAPARNFFTGALTPAIGKFTAVAKFYSAAPVPRDKYTLWLFAATDGQVHLVDGVSDQVAKLGWGSDLASVKTTCGAGWQVLATASGNDSGDLSREDSVRAYEFPDRDPVAVSAAVEFAGPVSALWTESKGDSVVAVSRNRETGSYEAFRLALSCSQ